MSTNSGRVSLGTVGWAESSKPARATGGIPGIRVTSRIERYFIQECNIPTAEEFNGQRNIQYLAAGKLGFTDSAQPTIRQPSR
jgi:hypothetical protein